MLEKNSSFQHCNQIIEVNELKQLRVLNDI